MTLETWDKWISNLMWIQNVAEGRNWDLDKLVIKEPVSEKEFQILESENNLEYPIDFKEVLTKYSSGILLNWQIEGEETEGDYRQIFCGGGRGYLWDFETLSGVLESYKGWIANCFSDPDDDYDKVWYNKIPFIDVPNGDIIAFGEKEENGHPVIYLSHEDGELHGKRLGENFIDFITRWTNIGCVGTEDWQFEPFYDFDNSIIKISGAEVDNWKKWLDK